MRLKYRLNLKSSNVFKEKQPAVICQSKHEKAARLCVRQLKMSEFWNCRNERTSL